MNNGAESIRDFRIRQERHRRRNMIRITIGAGLSWIAMGLMWQAWRGM